MLSFDPFNLAVPALQWNRNSILMSDRLTTHLRFLDGIRGLSALYVCLDHAYTLLYYAGVGSHGKLAHALMAALKPLAFGRYSVDMFIVLSGYCLMLPVIRGSGVLRGGFKGYITRRAVRILPPYYAALALSLLLVACSMWLQPLWTEGEPLLKLPSFGDLIAHMFLVHNLVNQWAHGINSPMWSVATEWQIYFLFPALLIPIWRRGSVFQVVAAAFGFGYAAHVLVPGGLDGAAPWFAGLFALGMVAAGFDFSVEESKTSPAYHYPWGRFFVGLFAALTIAGILSRGWFRDHSWVVDPIFGLAAMCLIIYCARASHDFASSSLPLRLLASRGAVGLGAFSYSLYLVHFPLLRVILMLSKPLESSPAVQIAVIFLIGVPMTVSLAYLFHLAFERPFMPSVPRNLRQAEIAAAISPAP